jgi:predicted metalloprotease with PDZ domain
MEVVADVDGNVSLLYLNNAWGETDLYQCLTDIKVINSDARIKRVPEQNRIVIKGEPKELLKIKYVIRQDFSGEANQENYYRPIINHQYFHLFGHRLFLLPQHLFKAAGKQNVSIKWNDVNHLVQHNFGTQKEGTYDLSQNELLESVVVGGDFRRHSININGIELHLLTRGKWLNLRDKELVEEVESIINVQRSFWKDYSDDIYTVTLLPLNSESGVHLGGTGLAKGFASYCSNNTRSDLRSLTSLYYHEIMHHWIGGKIRNDTESKELWFSEGFTEYFSYLLMKENGEISRRKFKVELRTAKQNLEKGPFRNINNDQIALNSATEHIPYLRGLLYANYLDERLQKMKDMELRDLMLIILNDTQQHNFSNEYFKILLHYFLGDEEVEAFEKYIEEGSVLPH